MGVAIPESAIRRMSLRRTTEFTECLVDDVYVQLGIFAGQFMYLVSFQVRHRLLELFALLGQFGPAISISDQNVPKVGGFLTKILQDQCPKGRRPPVFSKIYRCFYSGNLPPP